MSSYKGVSLVKNMSPKPLKNRPMLSHCLPVRCAGCLAVYALGFGLRWNQIALFAPVVPVAAFFVTFFIPESPVYLLSKV